MARVTRNERWLNYFNQSVQNMGNMVHKVKQQNMEQDWTDFKKQQLEDEANNRKKAQAEAKGDKDLTDSIYGMSKDELIGAMQTPEESWGTQANAAMAAARKRIKDETLMEERAKAVTADYELKQADHALRSQAMQARAAAELLGRFSQEAEHMNPAELATEVGYLTAIDPTQRTNEQGLKMEAFGNAYRQKRAALENPAGGSQEVTQIDPATGSTVKTKRNIGAPGIQLPDLGEAVKDPSKVSMALYQPAAAPQPTQMSTGQAAIFDGLASRMDAWKTANATKLSEHSGEMAKGDRRYGLFNMFSRENEVSELNKGFAAFDEDAAAFQWAQQNPNDPKAAGIIDTLNKKY